MTRFNDRNELKPKPVTLPPMPWEVAEKAVRRYDVWKPHGNGISPLEKAAT